MDFETPDERSAAVKAISTGLNWVHDKALNQRGAWIGWLVLRSWAE